ncbi:hypothetical protein FGE12_04200 [Aggregicoccus sp. 17bor-14]|uniref:ELWxxDGT repeat protein n=1 Tax=Myxococcaceae TaxID=31 RepID=UPI00129C96C0|nr:MULTISPECIES: ELWxxDGT repeat protein [Myxococcaceae]MBF5041576.1 hypothetical protein [Simulacricoccus sp. 17bor-14]MRI87362.1 hypothetical protein [Aggregicoccus sp. 17bor-14]
MPRLHLLCVLSLMGLAACDDAPSPEPVGGQAPPVEAEPQRIEIAPGEASSSPLDFATLNGVAYFSADDGTSGRELWRTDGTPAGTHRVADLRPGSQSSGPRWFAPFSGALYFVADGEDGTELWRTDGTVEGTRRVLDPVATGLRPSYVFSNPLGLFALSETPTDAQELWFLREGASTPVKLTNFAADGGSGFIHGMQHLGGLLYFMARQGTIFPDALWVTDGTPEGTRKLAGSGDTQWGAVGVLGQRYLFIQPQLDGGVSLRYSEGTPESTGAVAVLREPPATPMGASGMPYALLTTAGASTYFPVNEPDGTAVLWETDGTAAGTRRGLTLPGGSLPTPIDLRSWEDHLLFRHNAGGGASWLWVSDGTAAGTRAVTWDGDVRPDLILSNAKPWEVTAQHAFFCAQTPGLGEELWMADAGGVHARPVADLAPGAAGSDPAILLVLGNRLLFRADDGTHGSELWSLDLGVPATTGAAAPEGERGH